MECCNKTYNGAPHTGKETCACASDLSDASHVTVLVFTIRDEVNTKYILCHVCM